MSRLYTTADADYDYADITIPAAPLSMSAWFKTSTDQTQVVSILHSNSVSLNWFGLILGAGRTAVASVRNSTSIAATATTLYTLGAWTNLCGTVSESGGTFTTQVWLNGSSYHTNSGAISAPDLDRLMIGARHTTPPSGTAYFNGNVAEVAVWSGILTEANAVALAGGARADAVRSDILLDWRRLLSGDGQIDYAGSNDALSQNGTPADDMDHPTINEASGRAGSMMLGLIG